VSLTRKVNLDYINQKTEIILPHSRNLRPRNLNASCNDNNMLRRIKREIEELKEDLSSYSPKKIPEEHTNHNFVSNKANDLTERSISAKRINKRE
jgi:hypothetical protein